MLSCDPLLLDEDAVLVSHSLSFVCCVSRSLHLTVSLLVSSLGHERELFLYPAAHFVSPSVSVSLCRFCVFYSVHFLTVSVARCVSRIEVYSLFVGCIESLISKGFCLRLSLCLLARLSPSPSTVRCTRTSTSSFAGVALNSPSPMRRGRPTFIEHSSIDVRTNSRSASPLQGSRGRGRGADRDR